MGKIEISNGRKYWLIVLEGDELFNLISQDSNYREHVMEYGGGEYILLEDDRQIFDKILKNVVNELWLKLGRMSKSVEKGMVCNEDIIRMKFEVTSNYDDNMLPALETFINEYIESGVLKEWYIRNNISEEVVKCEEVCKSVLEKILSVVHYRKQAVKRPINPVF